MVTFYEGGGQDKNKKKIEALKICLSGVAFTSEIWQTLTINICTHRFAQCTNLFTRIAERTERKNAPILNTSLALWTQLISSSIDNVTLQKLFMTHEKCSIRFDTI